MSLFQVQGLVKRFGGLLATDHVSLSVQHGEIHALIGPNGAGKTTLVNQISGLLAPDEGRVLFDGRPLASADVQRIGYLPEERGLYKRMTPIDAIAFFAGLKGVPETEGRKRARAMLEAQGLGFGGRGAGFFYAKWASSARICCANSYQFSSI